MDADTLARTVDEARAASGRSSLLPPPALLAECEEIRSEKLAAIKAEQHSRAQELRDREQDLLEEALRPIEARQEELLSALRTRLGIAKP